MQMIRLKVNFLHSLYFYLNWLTPCTILIQCVFHRNSATNENTEFAKALFIPFKKKKYFFFRKTKILKKKKFREIKACRFSFGMRMFQFCGFNLFKRMIRVNYFYDLFVFLSFLKWIFIGRIQISRICELNFDHAL